MKKTSIIWVALLLVSTISFGQKIPADTIFSNFYKATGGKALWDGLKSYNIRRSYSAAAATPYDAVITTSLPDQSIYKSKTIMKRTFVYTVKGAQGWIKVPLGQKMDVKDLSQAEQQNMRMEMYDILIPFYDYKNRSLIATTVGTEAVNGIPFNQVELQGKGVKYNLWFDGTNGLLVRQKITQGGIETTTEMSNYVKSGYGILYPSKLVEINTVDKKPINIKSDVTINQSVNMELFKR